MDLVQVPFEENEAWEMQTVLKFQLQRQGEEWGTMYLDAFVRPEKMRGEVTLPIRIARSAPGPTRQTPKVVLSMDIASPSVPLDVSSVFLTINELAKLLHEFGHVLHYLVSETEFQCLSGARVTAFDFLETPST